jgi:hypothetical protein
MAFERMELMFRRSTLLESTSLLLLFTCSCSVQRTSRPEVFKGEARDGWISLNFSIDVDMGAGLACCAIGRRLCCMNEADLNDREAVVFQITPDTIDNVTSCNEQSSNFTLWGMGGPTLGSNGKWPVRALPHPREFLQWAVGECRYALLHGECPVVPGKGVPIAIYLRTIHDPKSPALQVIVAARRIGRDPPAYQVRVVSVRQLEEDEMVVQ